MNNTNNRKDILEANKEILKPIIDKNRKRFKEITRNRYLMDTARFFTDIMDVELTGETEVKEYLITNREDAMDLLFEQYEKETTRKNKTLALFPLIEEFDDKEALDDWNEFVEESANVYRNRRSQNELTKKESRGFVTTEQYKELLQRMFKTIDDKGLLTDTELNKREMSQLEDYILLAIYFDNPMRADLANLEITADESLMKDKNYLLVKEDETPKYEIVIQDHKTSKNFNELRYPLENESLIKVLDAYLDFDENEWLIYNKKRDRPANPNELSKRYKQIFTQQLKKPFTITMNRIRVASDDPKLQEYIKMTKEIREDAKKFGHSMETHVDYIKKL